MGSVLDGILLELKLQRDFLGVNSINTIYLGGGTPSVYDPVHIQTIIDSVKELWDCSAVDEITMESNPDDLTTDYLQRLTSTDINRLSIGIQSFNDSDLRLMNRRHTAAAAIQAVGDAQRLGYNNITIDLIYGVPGMSMQTWGHNVDTAIGLGVQHISAYHLSIEEKSRFGRMAARGEISEVAESASQQQYELLHERLAEAEFEHYEISNFAREGFRAKHNSAYWSGQPYLGVGPSAHSYNGLERRWSVSSVVKYVAGVGQGEIYESETLRETDSYNEFIMTSLRTADGVDLQKLEARFGAHKLQYFIDSAQKSLAQGVLTSTAQHVSIPYQHFLIADTIICEMFDN